MSGDTGWFVYGLIDTAEWTDQGEALRERLARVPGVEPEAGPVVHPVGRLGVLASAIPLEEYTGPDLENKMEDMGWLESRVRAHAAVITTAFELQAMLPLRFGAIFSSLEMMAEGLGPRQEEMLAELRTSREQEEWTVRFCANPDKMAEQMAREAAEAAQGAGRGAQYLLRRKAALQGRSGVASQLAGRAAEGHAALEGYALQSVPARSEVAGLPGGARSLLSRVYTIRRVDRQRFLAELEQVSAAMTGAGITALQSGPWPSVKGHSPHD